MSDATGLARAVLGRLIAAGVRDLVLAPGSRNAPIAFAAHDAAAAGSLRLHTRIDERTAAFLALGLARTAGSAAVACTSGTAVAHLHPAMLEALHSPARLVALTADRPARLRGTSANQTTTQPGIFSPHVPCLDLAPGCELEDLGSHADQVWPLHVNLQLDLPLTPPDRWVDVPEPPAVRRDTGFARWRRPEAPLRLPPGPRTVVVAGDDAGPPARILAERAGWPLLAEPTSGSRTGENAIRCYRLLLSGELGRQVERVVVVGHPTLSRPVTDLLNRPGVEVLAHRMPGVATRRPFPVAAEFDAAEAPDPDGSGWWEQWRAADAELGARLDRLLGGVPELTAYEVAGAVARALPPEGLLVVGASNPIRDLDLMVPRYRVGDRRKVIANRGLSGIDGTISTAIGAALGRPSSSRAFALMGDLTFLHDANGLVLGPDEPRPDLTIVVANDDGGSVFATLEQGAPAYADRYDRLFGLPHGVDLAALCAATRTPHWPVDSLPELEQALASPNGGIEVVEARVRRDDRRELDARIRALVSGHP